MKLLSSIETHHNALPEKPALIFVRETLTYHGLVTGARRLAGFLCRSPGVGAGPVAVLGGREALTPLCFLACALAGAAFLPLDPACPPARRQDILRDSGATLCLDLLTPVPTVGRGDVPAVGRGDVPAVGRDDVPAVGRGDIRWEASPCPVGGRDGVLRALEAAEEGDLPVACDSDLFYLIYTSGSSGVPKGVEVTGGNLSAFLSGALPLFGSAPPVTLSHAAFSFDLSVLPLWGTLALGGTLIDLDPTLDWKDLFARMTGSGATFWVSTPSFARVCLADPAFDRQLLPAVKTFFFCGETLPHATAEALFARFPEAEVINAYGPTEATVAATWCAVTKEMAADSRPLPVGVPFPGIRVAVVDGEGRPLPPGELGEILIAGPTVARGYRGVPHAGGPFGTISLGGDDLPCYRTGDLGFLEGDTLHFRGRKDRQVKIRGMRLELEDVEMSLRRLPGVAAAAAVFRGGENPRLLVAVEPLPGATPDPAALRKALGELLPPYMVPRRIVVLDRLPLTTGGKVDLSAIGGMLK